MNTRNQRVSDDEGRHANEADRFYSSDEHEDEIQHLPEEVQENASNSSGRGNSGITNHFDKLEELIYKLNDEDHSEDQGIEDYNVGGYHPCHVGEVLMNRYVLMQKLGWGHFSTVWLAKDFKYGNFAAVKIMKSSPHYLEASYDEVQILQKVATNAYHPEWIKSLKDYEPQKTVYERDDTHVLNLLNSFLYKGPYGNHFCMVFQILGVNLLEILKRYDEKGLPLELVKEIARQVLMGLDFLNRICRVIHTDLKPENVLLCLPDVEIKSIFEDQMSGNLNLYKDRINYYRYHYKLGPVDPQYTTDPSLIDQIKEPVADQAHSENDQLSEFSEISNIQNKNPDYLKAKITQIMQRLSNGEAIKKCQRKNLKRKLKKYEDDLSKICGSQLKKVESVQKKQKSELKRRLLPSTKKLFTNFKSQLVLDKGAKLSKGFKVKIADLGNACWEHHHFASEIQTRQYRGPQILIGSKYNISADMWSAACMFFEMLTGELLFNPRKDGSDSYGKNDDHLAQMMELIGRFPKKFSTSGAKSKRYFTKEGNLRRIPKLQNWSIKHVMIAKYRFNESEAALFEDFMTPMLQCWSYKRVLAHDMLKHPWLHAPTPAQYFMNPETHAKIKAERYELEQPKDEVNQYESEKDDADQEDNAVDKPDADEDAFYQYEKKGDIKLIDRSFMDLGYIGFGDGIFLQNLDAGPNWQFENS